MSKERLNLLKKYTEEEPNEPFNWYALANEYIAYDLHKALECFILVLNKFPDYLPSYYQAAKLLVEVGKDEQAIDVYQKGKLLAKAQGNQKIFNELNSAYQNLLFEME